VITANQSGFSLLEVIIVMAILSAISAVAIPAWNKILSSYHLVTSARLIQSELQSLKIRAAAENATFRLSYIAGATTFHLLRDGTVIAERQLSGGVLIANTGAVTFSSRGTASGNRVRIMNLEGVCQQVVVSQTGRMRTCQAACTRDC
jgi:prepilin-type N-terminal cleavage/methylation domain-containing protein